MAPPTKKASGSGGKRSRGKTKKAGAPGGRGTAAVRTGTDGPVEIIGSLAPGAALFEHFKVERTIVPHQEYRSGIFVCRDLDADRTVVVKIAGSRTVPDTDLVKKVSTIDTADVIEVFSSGDFDGYFYEIMEYCAGGPLADYIPDPDTGEAVHPNCAPLTEEDVERIIPEAFNGLRVLHDLGIVHRDIKPENLYFRNFIVEDGKRHGKDLVLGDFDISSALAAGVTSRVTSHLAGTWAYEAPESIVPQLGNISGAEPEGIGLLVRQESDYYRLGVTLIKLLVGFTPLDDRDHTGVLQFYAGAVPQRLEIPESINQRLRLLLRGLLIRDYRKRWGQVEVSRWLKGKNTDSDRHKIENDKNFAFGRPKQKPYMFKYTDGTEERVVELRTIAELAQTMVANFDSAKDHILTSQQKVLVAWVGRESNLKSMEAINAYEGHSNNPEKATLAFLLALDPNVGFPVGQDGCAAGPLEFASILDDHASDEARHKEAERRLKSGLFAFWLRSKADPRPELAESLEALIASTEDDDTFLEEVLFALDTDRNYWIIDDVEVAHPKEMPKAVYGKSRDWSEGMPAVYEAAFEQFTEGAIQAWLRQRGCGELDDRIKEEKSNFKRPVELFEKVLRSLDPKLPKIKVKFKLSPDSLSTGVWESTEAVLSWETIGPGIPFGVLSLDREHPGVDVKENTFSGRKGRTKVFFDSTIAGAEEFGRGGIVAESSIIKDSPVIVDFKYSIEGMVNAIWRQVIMRLPMAALWGAALALFLVAGTFVAGGAAIVLIAGYGYSSLQGSKGEGVLWATGLGIVLFVLIATLSYYLASLLLTISLVIFFLAHPVSPGSDWLQWAIADNVSFIEPGSNAKSVLVAVFGLSTLAAALVTYLYLSGPVVSIL